MQEAFFKYLFAKFTQEAKQLISMTHLSVPVCGLDSVGN